MNAGRRSATPGLETKRLHAAKPSVSQTVAPDLRGMETPSRREGQAPAPAFSPAGSNGGLCSPVRARNRRFPPPFLPFWQRPDTPSRPRGLTATAATQNPAASTPPPSVLATIVIWADVRRRRRGREGDASLCGARPERGGGEWGPARGRERRAPAALTDERPWDLLRERPPLWGSPTHHAGRRRRSQTGPPLSRRRCRAKAGRARRRARPPSLRRRLPPRGGSARGLEPRHATCGRRPRHPQPPFCVSQGGRGSAVEGSERGSSFLQEASCRAGAVPSPVLPFLTVLL